MKMGSSLHPIFLAFFFILFRPSSSSTTYNVVSYGAHAGGSADSTTAFMKAWAAVCGSRIPAKMYVPKGKFLIKQTKFQGPCKNKAISLVIDGVISAPSDYKVIGHSDYWIEFKGVEGVSINGGMLDGQGSRLWDCKSSGKTCPAGATTLGFSDSKNVIVTGLTSLNSQMFHIVINGCHNMKLEAVKVQAPGNSPNTDGIHVQFSSLVSIINSKISTGDDCVSIGPGTKYLLIENVVCDPGHGISIGSLGRDLREPGVQNVTVKTATFVNTQNGVRIKTWGKPSSGFVRGVIFQHVTMMNVQNPIVIDQNYCPSKKDCPDQFSGVKISDVTYEDIHGTSATEVAVKFDCSKKNPCSGIRLQDVWISYKNQPSKSACAHADGMASGRVEPSSCF